MNVRNITYSYINSGQRLLGCVQCVHLVLRRTMKGNLRDAQTRLTKRTAQHTHTHNALHVVPLSFILVKQWQKSAVTTKPNITVSYHTHSTLCHGVPNPPCITTKCKRPPRSWLIFSTQTKCIYHTSLVTIYIYIWMCNYRCVLELWRASKNIHTQQILFHWATVHL